MFVTSIKSKNNGQSSFSKKQDRVTKVFLHFFYKKEWRREGIVLLPRVKRVCGFSFHKPCLLQRKHLRPLLVRAVLDYWQFAKARFCSQGRAGWLRHTAHLPKLEPDKTSSCGSHPLLTSY